MYIRHKTQTCGCELTENLYANNSDLTGILFIDNNNTLFKDDDLISKRNTLKFILRIHRETWNCAHCLHVQSAFRRVLGVIIQHFVNAHSFSMDEP